MKTAMILAAGRGERLRPITEQIPKSLCQVHHRPLIDYHLEALVQAGVSRVVINHAYLGGQIRRHLGDGTRFGLEILYAPEPPGGLETGGGLYHALPFLGNGPFIAVNADIYTDYPYPSLHLPENSLAHLVLVPRPDDFQSGDFGLGADHRLDGFNRLYTFSGIAVYHPKFFTTCQVGRYPLAPLFYAKAEARELTGELYHGHWIDIGSPKRLQKANQAEFRR